MCCRPQDEERIALPMDALSNAPRAATSRGLLCITLAAVLWGTVGVVTKLIFGLADTNPLSVGFWRLALATPALLLAIWPLLGRRLWQVKRTGLAQMLCMGAVTALYQVAYFA